MVIPRHLYVHAPFCARRCSYCDFAVDVAAEPPVEPWAEAVGGELERVRRDEGWSGRLALDTLYVGGGTPSLLGPAAMARLRAAVEPGVDLTAVEEFTSEANPESFTPEVAEGWRRAGVNRLSFGAQTFHAPSLRWMGRLHGPDGPGRAVERARAAGYDNLGLDLIFALPPMLGRDLGDDLDRVLALEPEHVSVYGLTVEKGTPLSRWVAEGRVELPDEDRYGEEYLLVADRLTAAGYVHYEVSNFALPGRESRHNGAYWRGVPYLGLGNGAHSYVPPRRWWNRRDWSAYRSAVAAGEAPRESEEDVTGEAGELERIWLDLRTRSGITPSGLSPTQVGLLHAWERHGWAEPADAAGRLRLTAEGWLLLDRLAVELEGAGHVVARGGAQAADSGLQRAGKRMEETR